jgi:hypothetical protein
LEIETGFVVIWKLETELKVEENFKKIENLTFNLIEIKYEKKENKKIFKNEEKKIKMLFEKYEEKKKEIMMNNEFKKKNSIFQTLYLISNSKEENDEQQMKFLKKEGIKKRRTLKILTNFGIMSYFDDILIYIFSFLDFETITNKICYVNSIWNKICWKSIKSFIVEKNENSIGKNIYLII